LAQQILSELTFGKNLDASARSDASARESYEFLALLEFVGENQLSIHFALQI